MLQKKSRLFLILVMFCFIYSSMGYAETKKSEKLEDCLWRRLASIINLEFGTITHERVEKIFGSELSLVVSNDNSYQYLGRLTSGEYFTVLVKEGVYSRFIFQWDNKINIEHDYMDVTKTPAPKNLCIRAFDKRGDIKIGAFIGRNYLYVNGQSISYLTFNRSGINNSVTNAHIYLDEERDCLLRLELKDFEAKPTDHIP